MQHGDELKERAISGHGVQRRWPPVHGMGSRDREKGIDISKCYNQYDMTIGKCKGKKRERRFENEANLEIVCMKYLKCPWDMSMDSSFWGVSKYLYFNS